MTPTKHAVVALAVVDLAVVVTSAVVGAAYFVHSLPTLLISVFVVVILFVYC